MKKLRDLATDLGGAGFFFGLALAAHQWDDLSALRVPLVTILAVICAVWAFTGLAHWLRTDSSLVTFKFPRANSWVSGNAVIQRALAHIDQDYLSREEKVRKEIGDYIFQKLLHNASKATILTHDLSWVEDLTGTPLERLASGKRLKIISCGRDGALPSSIDSLKRMGAEVCEVKADVEIRFTLVSFGGAQSLALARVGTESHTILRVTDPTDPVFQLAKELIASLDRERVL